jgi:hypothetical protein
VVNRRGTMSDAAAAFLEQVGACGHQPLLAKARGVLGIELLTGGDTDRWFVSMDRGDVAVSQDESAPDCIVRMDRALFDGMIRGEVNAMAALLRGEITVEGERELLLMFQRLMPARPGTCDRGVKATPERRP